LIIPIKEESMSGTTSTSYHQDFLSDTIGLTLQFLSEILSNIQTLEPYDPKNEIYWNQKIAQMTADIGQFVEITTLLSKLILKKTKTSISDIKESHISLLFIMKAIIQAQGKQDYLAMEELIKYELKDNLTQWKIDLIPQSKKLLKT